MRKPGDPDFEDDGGMDAEVGVVNPAVSGPEPSADVSQASMPASTFAASHLCQGERGERIHRIQHQRVRSPARCPVQHAPAHLLESR